MNLFLRFLKKDKDAASVVAAAPRPAAPVDKPAAQRFGKTVVPNASRVVGGEPMGSLPAPARFSMPTPAGSRTISLGKLGLAGRAPNAPGSETPGTSAAGRTITLPLADLAPLIPEGMLRPEPIDSGHRIILQASEVERGMANGRPSVLLRAIYQQAPKFFAREVDAADTSEVALPFAKVLEQFAAFTVRDDQVCDQEIPQVETPFLKVTMEDSERFGTPVAPLQASAHPAAAAQPATAATIAAAQPEAVTEIKSPARIRLSMPKAAKLSTLPPATDKISPNGTDVPATERVPASSGPSVPISLPSPLAPPAPSRIPFKVSPPSDDLRPAQVPKAATSRGKSEPIEFSSPGPRVRLPLRDVLRGIPPFQLSGPIDKVPAEAQIEIPFSIVEPQLALGRIAISPAQFQAAMPEEYRALFQVGQAESPVTLPLEGVLQNLPDASLRVRGDQEETEIAEQFETPFSDKAAEDAARLNVPTGPIAKPAVVFVEPEPTPELPMHPETAAALAEEADLAARPAGRTALQIALDTDDILDAKSVVAHASRLPGVSACAIVSSDGLSLAGNIPADYEADALCAMAPIIIKRLGDQMMGANLGSLTGVTLFCAKTPVSFFAHGSICLAALHSAGEIAAEIRTRLGCTVQELARMYAQPA